MSTVTSSVEPNLNDTSQSNHIQKVIMACRLHELQDQDPKLELYQYLQDPLSQENINAIDLILWWKVQACNLPI
jgi:hypothetical protein